VSFGFIDKESFAEFFIESKALINAAFFVVSITALIVSLAFNDLISCE